MEEELFLGVVKGDLRQWKRRRGHGACYEHSQSINKRTFEGRDDLPTTRGISLPSDTAFSQHGNTYHLPLFIVLCKQKDPLSPST